VIPRRVILETMTPQQVRTLVLLAKARGLACRSNYNAEQPIGDRWPLYWKTLEALQADGLIMRAGKFYVPTELGHSLIEQAVHRRIP